MKRCVLASMLLLAGCSMTPRYERPPAPIPESWPIGDAYLRQSEAALSSLGWRDLFTDPRLTRLVEQALVNNRDLRVAAANVATARARYRIQQAGRLPAIDASAGAGVGNNAGGSDGDFSIGLTPSFELDLFGRVAALTEAQQQLYFASEAGARATRLTLIGDVAEAWIAYAADATLLKVARDTAANAQRSVTLTRARLEGGISPRTDLRQAEQILATAQADIARLTTALAQDINALELLIGAPVDRALLPVSIDEAAATIDNVPAGLRSDILLRRPDILAAEYRLRAANAEIGAARAALFPSISLTGLIGFASDALGSLFTGDAFNTSARLGASASIFRGGALRQGVRLSEAERDAALAAYEGSIQSAFRDVADALARAGTYSEEERSVRALVAAADDTLRLTDARYRGGVDSFLARLDAERSLYQAQRTLVETVRGRAANRIAVYRALGGESWND
ncbi:MAG: efflux transporter outer membrane subunit [Sphingorhabdus sp.]